MQTCSVFLFFSSGSLVHVAQFPEGVTELTQKITKLCTPQLAYINIFYYRLSPQFQDPSLQSHKHMKHTQSLMILKSCRSKRVEHVRFVVIYTCRHAVVLLHHKNSHSLISIISGSFHTANHENSNNVQIRIRTEYKQSHRSASGSFHSSYCCCFLSSLD